MKNRATPVLASTVLALAACGGGDEETFSSAPADEATSASTSASANVSAAPSTRSELAAAAAQAIGRTSPRLQAVDASSWVKVADEWQSFVLTAPARVRYGAGRTWVERDMPAGLASCTNAFFGLDPLVGIGKSCEVQQQAAGAWVQVADEWQAFTLALPRRVRYGAGSTWIELDLAAGTALCSNAFFGNDPLVGVVKHCEAFEPGATPPAPPPGSWSYLADEWQPFRLDTARRVRYGAATTWIERDLPAGQGMCTNDFFGVDPLFGVVKRCEVLEEGGAPPPPPPATTTTSRAAAGLPAFAVSGIR
jgi:hypothetical protein